ncbi:Stk1 family PASTA domain-containing Ser/Thr kinase [Paenibacillus sp. IHBB 10380]|uniref:Stk1 family PASTA domain-containing Ser/Thr kinase n=1 Tax=Paenibacillus sp. IHBB 10380 TaxID=1566358 RepID=UPI0005CFCE71|nr:Stk1 family PASTA domain-containing Ser/Thr kinase [Paenibacillus sp. IHBB 10380]AJS57865.1 serine/threonine protein kinase [Paenibacillus sp. IHBB 10380]
MIGHELGGRYEIIERIGGGGMALVYKAHDILLGRNVAIKVLRQQFVHDEEFIRRFRREAQSAASLSHPNVVSIYDVGQEDEIHYIVMEYVEGYNLNEIIKERAPLQVEESVRIATQICDALDHAHQNQIIHRDIKPHNILIGRNGRVKVTDFGIARAVTSTTITQTGSLIGSVHYFSPEHAKGVATGEKSDLYSLGIVMYQMLTATLPFLGESPISVALKHLQEEFDDPRDVNPLIPQSVENIILKSMRKNPHERYQSAKEMIVDIETSLLPERRNEPKMQFADFDADQTRALPAIKVQQQGTSLRRNKDLFNEDDEDDKPMTSNKGKKKWTKPVLWISLTLFILIAMGSIVWYVNNKLSVQEVAVPSVINMQEDAAVAKLKEFGIEVGEITRAYNPEFDEGMVYDQSKKEGTTIKEGSSINLSVSTIKPFVTMPDVKSLTFEEASKILIGKKIKEDNIKQTSDYSDEPSGTVISQSPGANAEFDGDTQEIVLTVSKGPKNIPMPNLVGKTQQDAQSELENLGLELEAIKEDTSFQIEKGKVTQQWPYDPKAPVSPGSPGSKITLFVSTGYPAEALDYTFRLPVAPVEEGKKTKVRIVYSDARNEEGSTKEYGTQTIQTTQVFPVKLVLMPNKDAVVSVYLDGKPFDEFRIRYNDVKNGTVPEVVLPQKDPVVPPITEDEPVDVVPDQNNEEDPKGNADNNTDDVEDDTTAMTSSGKLDNNNKNKDKGHKGNKDNRDNRGNDRNNGNRLTSSRP